MYGTEPPLSLRVRELEQLELCPASSGQGSRLPRSALDRWIAAHDSLRAALDHGDIERALDDNASWLDPVQFEIVADLVRTGVQILTVEGTVVEVDPDHGDAIVTHPHLNIHIDSRAQIAVTTGDETEVLKLKTGKTGTSPAEAAVLLAGSDTAAPSGDLMLHDGTIEPFDLTEEQIKEHLNRLFSLCNLDTDQAPRDPGLHCFRCNRVATCGQYPPPPGVRIRSRHRTLRLSKTDVLQLDKCERRIAWKIAYAIPKEHEDEPEPGSARSTGINFHKLLAIAILAEDPDQAFEDGLQSTPPSEHQQMRWLYERHKALETIHEAVDCTRSEYPIGVTVPLVGVDVDSRDRVIGEAQVAVTVIAFADAVGRQADGTPAIVEHKTGGTADRIDERETALYAVAASRLLGVDTIAVHLHTLGLSTGPKCERIVYDAERLIEAEALLNRILQPATQWHPQDASDPAYTVSDWCASCSFQERCARFQNGDGADPSMSQQANRHIAQ